MKGMHLERGLSMINTRKRKTKITKAKYKELELRWRKWNKSMKQKGMHHLRYETLDAYIDYAYGRGQKPNPKDYKHFKPMQTQYNLRAEQDKEHRKKYPSLMEQQIKAGTFNSGTNSTGKKEPMKYTGTLVKGIATMHKSNAVPIISQEEATDIARMRRG
tara:strand:- start:3166 stop:3645 length:480 start_codon:yes stop_codon:yes gene_type:complete